MSYDKNGNNSHQDILDEIERVKRYKASQNTETSILAQSSAFQKGNKRVRSKGSPKKPS